MTLAAARVMVAANPQIRPLYPLIHRLLPNHSTTTSNLGRAMIQVAAAGYWKPVLYSADFNTLAAMR
jgi:hypothetical protein